LAGPAPEGAGLRQVRGGGAERGPQRPGRLEEVPRRDQGGATRPLCRCQRAGHLRAARGGLAGNAAPRRPGPRDRPPARPRRVGQRGRQAPDPLGGVGRSGSDAKLTQLRRRSWEPASRCAASPPPCGEGLGVGGIPIFDVWGFTPPCPSPTRGEGTLWHAPFRQRGSAQPEGPETLSATTSTRESCGTAEISGLYDGGVRERLK